MAVAATHASQPAAPAQNTGLTDRAKQERKLAWLLCAPAVAVMLLVAGFPIIYAFWLSLRRADLLRQQLKTSTVRPPTPSYADVTLAIQDSLHPPASINPQKSIDTLKSRLTTLADGGMY